MPPVAKTRIPAFCGAEHRPRDGRRAEATIGQGRGEIAATDLHRLPVLREPLDLRAVQPDDDPPIEEPNRRGHGPRRAHRLLHLPRQSQIVRIGKAVRR